MVRRCGEVLEHGFHEVGIKFKFKVVTIPGKRRYGPDEPEETAFCFEIDGCSVFLFLAGTEDAPDFDMSTAKRAGIEVGRLADVSNGIEGGESMSTESIVR
jgi:hypothetical protein